MHYRPMSFRDLPAVMEIELRAYPSPWTEGMFSDSLNNGHLCFIMLDGQDIICGYTVLYVAVGECHILNICVDPDRQGQGAGGELLQHVLGQAAILGAEQAILEVRPSNLPAIALYQGQGFQQIGRRKDYYPAPGSHREDALVFGKSLSMV